MSLIVGGENAKAGEFPHMAALGYNEKDNEEPEFKCGGSLISDEYVITAGKKLFFPEIFSIKFLK